MNDMLEKGGIIQVHHKYMEIGHLAFTPQSQQMVDTWGEMGLVGIPELKFQTVC